MTATLEVRRVSEEQRFLQLEERWNALSRDNPTLSIFGRHEWFVSAWQWCRHDNELYLLCAYRGEALVGILPLMRQRIRRSALSCRTLAFLAVPDTQSCDLVVSVADAAPVARAMAAWLADARDEWDTLELDKLAESSLVVSELEPALAAASLRGAVGEDSTSPGIPLDGDWDAYYASRSTRLRSGNNNIANKLKREGSIEVLWSRGAEIADQAALDDVLETSARSWKQGTGLTLDQPGPQDFIRRLTDVAIDNGWLSIWTLRLDGRPVATEYQVIYGGCAYALRADYDASYRKVSPGSYLNWKLLEQLFGAGIGYYCMGPGVNPYKDRWATDYPQQYRATFYGRTARARLLRLLDTRIRPWLRKCRSMFSKG